uniref:Uncharacterized protein n=1 Tax=Glossina palpalis gambiensis TaxID=67801 RepID=A0A1B0BCC6_9MUSC
MHITLMYQRSPIIVLTIVFLNFISSLSSRRLMNFPNRQQAIGPMETYLMIFAISPSRCSLCPLVCFYIIVIFSANVTQLLNAIVKIERQVMIT